MSHTIDNIDSVTVTESILSMVTPIYTFSKTFFPFIHTDLASVHINRLIQAKSSR